MSTRAAGRPRRGWRSALAGKGSSASGCPAPHCHPPAAPLSHVGRWERRKLCRPGVRGACLAACRSDGGSDWVPPVPLPPTPNKRPSSAATGAAAPPSLASPPQAAGRLFSPEDLRQYDGRSSSGGWVQLLQWRGRRPLYLAVLGEVFDVTPGARHYGEAFPAAAVCGCGCSVPLPLPDVATAALSACSALL